MSKINKTGTLVRAEDAPVSIEKNGPDYLNKKLEDLTWQDARQWLTDIAQYKSTAIKKVSETNSWHDLLFLLIERGQVGNYQELTPNLKLVPLEYGHIHKFIYNPYNWQACVAIAIEIFNDYELTVMYKQIRAQQTKELQEEQERKKAEEQRAREEKSALDCAEEFRKKLAETLISKFDSTKKTYGDN